MKLHWEGNTVKVAQTLSGSEDLLNASHDECYNLLTIYTTPLLQNITQSFYTLMNSNKMMW